MLKSALMGLTLRNKRGNRRRIRYVVSRASARNSLGGRDTTIFRSAGQIEPLNRVECPAGVVNMCKIGGIIGELVCSGCDPISVVG